MHSTHYARIAIAITLAQSFLGITACAPQGGDDTEVEEGVEETSGESSEVGTDPELRADPPAVEGDAENDVEDGAEDSAANDAEDDAASAPLEGFSLHGQEQGLAARAPMNVCVGVSPQVAPVSRRQKHIQTECSPKLARSRAIDRARSNARDAIEDVCKKHITHDEAKAACAHRGLRLASESAPLGNGIAHDGTRADATFRISSSPEARLCVVVRDLKGEYESVKQPEGICLLDGFKRTIFTAYARARCGVQCVP